MEEVRGEREGGWRGVELATVGKKWRREGGRGGGGGHLVGERGGRGGEEVQGVGSQMSLLLRWEGRRVIVQLG